MSVTDKSFFVAVAMRCMVAWASVLPGVEFPARLCSRRDTVVQNDASDSIVVTCSGGVYGWPGVEIRPPKNGDAWDWSKVERLEVAVSNRSDVTERVTVGVGGEQERILTHQTSGVPAHSVRKITVMLNCSPYATDGHVLPNGSMKSLIPCCNDSPLAKTTIVTVYSEQPGTQHPFDFSILGMRTLRSANSPQVLHADSFCPFVDRYGQFKHGEWPGKIHSDEELRAAYAAEDAWLVAHSSSPTPDVNEYGGWTAGPQLDSTGFFRVEKVDGRWWFVDPCGRLFFSFGVNSILHPNHPTQIKGRETWFEDVPLDKNGSSLEKVCLAGRNLARRFGERWHTPFARSVHDRCKAWGLNTLGCWCQPYVTMMRRTPYTATIGISSKTVLPSMKKVHGRAVPDVFSQKFVEDLSSQAEKLAQTVRDDPWCIGVYVDNEIDWQSCGGDVAAAAEKYYSTVRKTLKAKLPNHLYLGSRIHSAPKEVWLAASRHCDVVSSNIYMREPADDLERYAPDKPLLIGEFHFGARDCGMFGGGMVEVADQRERGECLRRYVEACLENPRCVGCHWYMFHDEPLTGRLDGENWNIGLVSVCDVPYPEMVEALRDVAALLYVRRAAICPKITHIPQPAFFGDFPGTVCKQ